MESQISVFTTLNFITTISGGDLAREQIIML